MNNELVQTGFFDVELDTPQKTWHIGLEDRLQDTLRQRAAKIKAVVAQANFLIGEELATAQKELTYKNGGFVKWLEEEVGIDNERAYEFIRIWENYKLFADSANISSLGKSVLLAGAKEGVPESAREEIVTRHEAGEKITLAVSDDIIAKHKAELEEEREARQELQRSFNLFKEAREEEKKRLNNKIQAVEHEKTAKEDEILRYKQLEATLGNVTQIQEKLRREARQQLDKDLEKQRQEQKAELKRKEKEFKELYAKKEQDLQLKAENTIRSLLSHGIKSMAETQLTIEHTVSSGMLQAVQQLGGKQVDSFLAQAQSLQEELDRVVAKLTQGDYLVLEERISTNG